MKRFWSLLLLVVAAAPSYAQSPAAASGLGPSAPDAPAGSAREAELAKRALAIVSAFSDSEPAFTRDGKRIVFSSNRGGLPQLYVAEIGKPSAPTQPIVTTKERIPGALPLPDGLTLLFLSDKGADENWSMFTVGVDGRGLKELTPDVERQRDSPFVPDGAATTVFYSARAMAEPGSSVYSLALAGGAERKIYEEKVPGFLVDVSRDGRWGLYVRYANNTDNALLLLDLGTGLARQLFPPAGAGTVQVWNASFAGGPDRVLVATDGGGERSLLLALDRDGRETARYVETEPSTASIEGLFAARTGHRVAINVNAGNHNEVRLLDAATLKLRAKVSLPLGTGTIGDFSTDGRQIAATWSTPNAPGQVFVIDVDSGKAAPLREEHRPSIADLPKVEASIVDVPAFDGLRLPTNVYQSAGPGGQKRPVIVVYHGGPAGSSAIRWSAMTRFFTALGYVVVEPNVRGSSGFGRAFEMADNGPQRLDAFRDIETTARWAAAQPWADKDRMVVFGGSYGGYTVLIALERWPDIWRAGVDLFGIANMTTFLQSTSGLIREVFKLEFGDLDRDGRFLKQISPIEEVDKIADPVFVYAGANDPRVPRPESDQIVRALRERKVPVEYMVAENEGHSLARRENQVSFYSRAARFLETQLQAK